MGLLYRHAGQDTEALKSYSKAHSLEQRTAQQFTPQQLPIEYQFPELDLKEFFFERKQIEVFLSRGKQQHGTLHIATRSPDSGDKNATMKPVIGLPMAPVTVADFQLLRNLVTFCHSMSQKTKESAFPVEEGG